MILATLTSTKSIEYEGVVYSVGDTIPYVNGHGELDDIKIICFYRTQNSIVFSGQFSSTGKISEWHSLNLARKLKDNNYKVPEDFVPYWVARKDKTVQYKMFL